MAEVDARVDATRRKKSRKRAGFARVVAAVARELDIPVTHARRVIEHYHEVLRDEVWQYGRVMVPKLGSFRVRQRKARRITAPPGTEAGDISLGPTETISFRATSNWRSRGAP